MPRRLQVVEVNPHVVCALCEGYLVDATTITECLHSFCRTCILHHLANSKFCPVCDVQIHKSRPLLCIRADQTLQDLAYKMIPGLYENEMQRRREFYSEHPEAAVGLSPEDRGEGEPRFYSSTEKFSVSLVHGPKDPEKTDVEGETIRYLCCPGAFTVGHLKKFIYSKFGLRKKAYNIDLYYEEHSLKDFLSMMDVAYIYSWKRASPMTFYYSITKRTPQIVESVPASIVPETPPVESTSMDQIPEENNCVSASSEPEKMETEEETAKPDCIVPDVVDGTDECVPAPLEETKEDIVEENVQPESSMSDDVQKMDVEEVPAVVKPVHSSLLERPAHVPIAEPTYNRVKVVSAPERNTLLSPTNGFRLKFIHDPALSPKPRTKKSGRKGGRSSRHKSAPVRLARLAPYPPPPPTTCLTTQPLQHLPQITVGKFVPTVITTLAPTLVTTLVSTTACNAPQNPSAPQQVAPFLNQSAVTCSISTNGTFMPASVPENNMPKSSTTTVNVNASPCARFVNNLTLNPADNNTTTSKELPSTELTLCSVPPACVSDIIQTSSASGTSSSQLERSSHPDGETSSTSSTSISETVLTNDSALSCHQMLVPASAVENSVTTNHSPRSVPPSAEVECTETIASKSVDNSSSNTVPINATNSDSFRGQSSCSPVTPSITVTCDDKNSPSPNHQIEQVFKGSPDKEFDESFKIKVTIKNSISAEFNSNDDLGCQADLVVDEQKMDSSDNEDDADDALRKKITAIAEKEDETDDTEADSGRASDMSCPARGEDEVGSPMPNDTSTHAVSGQSVSAPSTTSCNDENPRHVKSSNIDDVIKQLYRQHEIGRPSCSTVLPKPIPPPPVLPPKDDNGVLDLSTCTRKLGETPSFRPKAVANPVLDIKHRQQTYLPAPTNKQHTVCPPAPTPKPHSSSHLHALPPHPSSILHAQLTSGSAKSAQHQLPFPAPAVPYSHRTISSPTCVPGRAASTTFSHKSLPGAAHQSMVNFMPNILQTYAATMMNNMTTYAGRNSMGANISMPNRANAHQKDFPPATATNNKLVYGCYSKQSSSTRKLLDSVLSDSPNSRGLAQSSSPHIVPTHPRTSPSMLRLSPHHRSASPAPVPVSSLAATSVGTTATSSLCKPSTSSAVLKSARWKNGKNAASKFGGIYPYQPSFDQALSPYHSKHKSPAE